MYLSIYLSMSLSSTYKWKTEARSVDHLKSLNKGLEIKIIQLQQKLTNQITQNDILVSQNNKLDNRCQELMGMASFYDDYISLRKEMEEVKTELKKERQKGLSQEEEINKMKMELININELHKQVKY